MAIEDRRFSARLGAIWLWAGSLLVTLGLILVGFLRPSDLTNDAFRFLSTPSSTPTGDWLALMLILVLGVGGCAIWVLRGKEQRTEALRREKSDLEQELRHAKNALAHTDHLMVTDPITGIPNFRSWERHAEAWPRTESARKPSCLILIDLDRLGWLNETSHECANKVLELFATRTYEAMRRNEHAFKVPDSKGPHAPIQNIEMFRHYAGGDEFIFHLSDDVYGALGFLSRLQTQCAGYEREIKQSILRDYMSEKHVGEYKLQFCSAIVPIPPGVSPERTIESGLNMLTAAKKHRSTRVILQFENKAQRTLTERLSELRRDEKALDDELAAIARLEPAGVEQRKTLEGQLHELRDRMSRLTQAERAFSREAKAHTPALSSSSQP